MNFIKVPTYVSATKFAKHGDHPAVLPTTGSDTPSEFKGKPGGWIKTLEGGHYVDFGAYVLGPGAKGEYWPVDAQVFEATYVEAPAVDWRGTVEALAEAAHTAWFIEKVQAGVTSRLSSDGHEQMLPWPRLHEAVKDSNRMTAQVFLAAMVRLGLWRPPLPVEKVK